MTAAELFVVSLAIVAQLIGLGVAFFLGLVLGANGWR